MFHTPVLVNEVLELLAIRSDGIYIDGTIGLGGHCQAILNKLDNNGRIIGIDKDEEMLKISAEKIKDRRLTLVKGDFSEIDRILEEGKYQKVDGILFDLGVSMAQLKTPGRGFSFDSDERLDMRMDRSISLTAWEVINRFSHNELARIIKEYSEEPRWRKIVKAIVEEREKHCINTCRELSQVILKVYRVRVKRHPATRTFQALRIYVNKELSRLSEALVPSLNVLNKGGRLCVISYHSLEDRLVKNFFKEQTKKGNMESLTKKPITPSDKELSQNPSSRSAKLRGGIKL